MKKLVYILIGIVIASVGVIILKHSNLVTGGTAGLTLSITYLTGFPFAILFFLINLPFYLLSIKRLGLKFTLSTLGSITALTIVTYSDQWLPDFTIPMLVGSISGGFLIGVGLSLVLMHGSSLGGANILALHLQKKHNLNPAKVIFLFDLIVVCSGIYTVGLLKGICSILSIFITAKVVDYYKNEIANSHSNPSRKVYVKSPTPQTQVVLGQE